MFRGLIQPSFMLHVVFYCFVRGFGLVVYLFCFLHFCFGWCGSGAKMKAVPGGALATEWGEGRGEGEADSSVPVGASWSGLSFGFCWVFGNRRALGLVWFFQLYEPFWK